MNQKTAKQLRRIARQMQADQNVITVADAPEYSRVSHTRLYKDSEGKVNAYKVHTNVLEAGGGRAMYQLMKNVLAGKKVMPAPKVSEAKVASEVATTV